MTTGPASDKSLAERRARRAAAQEVFDMLAADYLGRPGVTTGPMFGSQGLLRDGRFFAFVGRAGDLVLKLPEQQSAALQAAGAASAVRAGRNPTREWVSVPRPIGGATDRWSALLADAYRYAGRSGPG
jgi:TfoX/Sxy family transcriptional regulator of competence genes